MNYTPISAPACRRIRLTPDVRSQKILDSALAQFSRNGFAATRIEDIARGAGLSKSGLYAHYQGKEEVFEALLTRALVPMEVVPFNEDDTVTDFADRFLQWIYARMGAPEHQAMLRLMLAEAGRIPELLQRWRQDFLNPALQAQVEVLRAAVARGQLVGCALSEDLSIAYAPALYTAILNMLPEDAQQAQLRLQKQRAAHREMLLALLRVP